MNAVSTLKQIGLTLLPVNLSPAKIVEYAITAQVGLLPIILVWALTLETLHALGIVTGPWDLHAVFNSVMDYEIATCGLIATGSAHAYFKKTTGPDGTETETDDVAAGKQPDNIMTTIVKQ